MGFDTKTIDELFTQIAEQIDEEDPTKYHHHTRLHQDQFIKAQDNGIKVKALCGLEKSPDQDNPLRKPCCPKCAKLMQSQCLGQFYNPQ